MRLISRNLGAIVITLVSLAILIAFNRVAFFKKLKALPGALVVVVAGVLINGFFKVSGSNLAIGQEHLVSLPVPKSFNDFVGQFSLPNFAEINKPDVWN